MGGKGDQSCQCTTVAARTWLIIFNSIFVLLGLGVAVGGGILKFGRSLVSGYVVDMLDQADTSGGDSISDVLDTVAIAMLVAGVLLLAFGLLGCCGGCCLVKKALLVYSLIMIKLLVAEVTLVIVWFVMRNMIEDRVKGALQGAIDTFYAGDAATDAVSMGFNWLFTELDCCGIDNYTDLYSASSWNRTQSTGDVLETPVLCCKLEGSYPTVTIPSSLDCAVTPNSTVNNYDTGCYSAFFTYIQAYQIYLIVVGVCLVVCEVCSAVSAIILKKKAGQKKNQVSPPQSASAGARAKEKALAKNGMNF